MVQNVSDEEDDTWGIWTAQGNSQQAPSQAPTTFLRRTEQIVSDEEDDTWEKWTAQGNSQWASTTSAATEHNTHHTHLAAVILDAAIERTASSSYTAARTKAWFNNLKQDVIDVTFVPITRCDLSSPPRHTRAD